MGMKKNNTFLIPVEYKRLFDNDWREAAVYGGRYSMKSHTVARYLLIKARESKMRIGCFREFQNSIAESSHKLLSDLIAEYNLTDFNVTDNSIINTITGSDFLFKGLHRNEQGIKSIEGIDIAWVEEAQTISKESIEILTPTIRKEGSKIIYTYNRLTEEDPVHKRLVMEGRPNTLILNINYDVADKYGFIPSVIKMEIEDDKASRPNLYKQKWLGEPIGLDKKIYKDWATATELPHEAKLVRRGLDFGYSNDPTALVDIYYYNGGYILNEVIFQKGLSNKQIADIILSQSEQCLVVADSAEPKSIDEIRSYGVNIIATVKGKDSINQGIQFVQDQRISVTSRSTNVLNEYRNFFWKSDINGIVINVPESGFDHCFSPYSMVHTTKGKIAIKDLVGKEGYVYSKDGKIERFYNVRPTRINAEMISLHLEDDNILTVTPDHLLLMPNGQWKEASCFVPKDMIQYDTYEQDFNIQWLQVYKIFFREILQRISKRAEKVVASLCMGNRKRRDFKGSSYSPQGSQQRKQYSGQSRNDTQINPSFKSYNTGKKGEDETMGRNNKTSNKEVAQIRRGNKVAQVEWTEDIRTKRTYIQRMLSLPQDLHHKAICKVRKILQSELQNESKAKKIKRITRGFSPVTYNLEVENTHCLMVDGAIAHNSMDSIRYAFSTLQTVEDEAPLNDPSLLDAESEPLYSIIGI